MSNYRMNWFENLPTNELSQLTHSAQGMLMINAYYFPGSISFNNVNIVGFASGTTAKTASFSLGLYSYNAGTLSLANSASRTWNPVTNATSYLSMATSATQDITPGIWYIGIFSRSSSTNRMSILATPIINGVIESTGYGGPFFRGRLSATTTALPSSIATSALSKEGTSTNTTEYAHPYVIITA